MSLASLSSISYITTLNLLNLMPMDINHFSHLKEVQSLDKMIKKHLDAIEGESSRKAQILKLRLRRETEKESLLIELNENTALISEGEKSLFDWDKKLAKANEQLPLAVSEQQVVGLQKEKDLSEKNVEKLQDEVLSLLEVQEQIEVKIEECDSFLLGSASTLKKIEEEILEVTTVEQREIDNYESRIKALLEEVPEPLNSEFKKAWKKHRFKSPLSRVMEGGCERCRFLLDRTTQSRIELLQTIEICSQCERLLIPYNA